MIIIIGAGISGLTAAERLKKKFMVIEMNSYPGGLSTQYRSGDRWFDFSGHYFHFSGKEDIRTYVNRFSSFREYHRDSRVFMFGKFIPFPVQYHLSYFPQNTAGKILEEIKNRKAAGADNMADSLRENFGETLYRTFFSPFLTKYYGRDLSGIIPDMDRGSIPVPDITNVEEGIAGKDFSETGYNPRFFYPDAGLRSFISSIESKIQGKINYNEKVVKIDIGRKEVFTDRGKFRFAHIINTMPLKHFVNMCGPLPELEYEADSFEAVSTLVVNMILRKKRRNFHWVYLPEGSTGFYRAGYYPGHPETACYLEKSIPEGFPEDMDLEKASAADQLRELGMIHSGDEIVHADVKIIPGSYVIFNKKWRGTVPRLLDYLRARGIYSIGRYGSWNYSSMSDDIKTAIDTAEELNGE
jgi:protoporphyrinogen oxidase